MARAGKRTTRAKRGATNRMVIVVAPPGGGKTTASTLIRNRHGRKTEQVTWDYSDMHSQELANIMGRQKLSFELGDGGFAELGVFGYTGSRKATEGTDRYTCVRRTRLKALVREFYHRYPGGLVWFEGLLPLNRPFLETVHKLAHITMVRITTPLDVCEKRWRARNQKMLDDKDYPTFTKIPYKTRAWWVKWETKLKGIMEEFAHESIECATPEEAADRVVPLLTA